MQGLAKRQRCASNVRLFDFHLNMTAAQAPDEDAPSRET